MELEKVSSIYDHLFEFEKEKGKGAAYPIHKALKFTPEQRAQGITDISELVLDFLQAGKNARILDAGCGVGYTLQKICKNPLYSGLGISLSKRELAFARSSASFAGISQRCQFKLADFDQAFGQQFDLILCMESIKHAPDWKKSLKNLAKHLKQDGGILLVEDFYQSQHLIREAKRFQEVWSVPELFSYQEVLDFAESLGLEKEKEILLDAFVQKKSAWQQKTMAGISQLSSHLFPSSSPKKQLLQIYEGALLMDYLYAKSLFSYRLLYFQFPHRKVENK